MPERNVGTHHQDRYARCYTISLLALPTALCTEFSKVHPLLQGGSFGFIHDILVTDEHYIILENPIKMNFGKLLSKYALAKACLAECLEYQASKPTKIHVIPRPGKQSSVLGM